MDHFTSHSVTLWDILRSYWCIMVLDHIGSYSYYVTLRYEYTSMLRGHTTSYTGPHCSILGHTLCYCKGITPRHTKPHLKSYQITLRDTRWIFWQVTVGHNRSHQPGVLLQPLQLDRDILAGPRGSQVWGWGREGTQGCGGMVWDV